MIKLNGQVVFDEKFPNGESVVPSQAFGNHLCSVIDFKYETDADLMQLYMLKRELGNQNITLNMPYFPYSRMDRRRGYMFSLKHVCKFINDLQFDKVRIMEAHSDVTTALLDNVENVYGTEKLLYKALSDGFIEEPDMICYPDASAAKRYYGIKNLPAVTMQKHRDFLSGKLTDMEMHGEMLPDAKVLIVDDLCSAGGTFQWAADIMKGAGAASVTLLVAHCEPTVLKGLSDPDKNQLDLIVTTDSIIDYSDVASNSKVYIYSTNKVML